MLRLKFAAFFLKSVKSRVAFAGVEGPKGLEDGALDAGLDVDADDAAE